MHLRDIQNSWNALVPIAVARGIDVQHWAVPPQTRDRGLRRLNWLRQQLGIPVPTDQVEFEHSPGAALPPIREIAAQYNALVPEALARGIRNVRPWAGVPSTSLRGMQRLQWLRRQLGHTVSTVAIVAAVEGIEAFTALTFGLEFECHLPRNVSKYTLRDALVAAGVPAEVEVYNHVTRPGHWKIVMDGSIGRTEHDIEVVSPPLHGEAGFQALRKACAVMTEKKCRITSKCGLHVHVGWKGGSVANPLWDGSTLRNLVRLYNRYEPVIDSLLVESRRGPTAANGFANTMRHTTNANHLNTARTWQEVCLAIGQNPDPAFIRGGDRYKKINLKPIGKYGTIEFRQHQGTVDAEETEHWLRFVLRLVLASKNNVHWDDTQALTLDELKNIAALDASEAKHFQERLRGFERRAAAEQRRQERRQARWRAAAQQATGI